jgi:hypothetical protein
MSKSSTIDIDAFNWVRQGTDTSNLRYCLGGIYFNPDGYHLTTTNGVALLRADLSPNIGEALAQALDNKPTLLLPPSGKIRWECSAIAKINKDNISIFGNNFEISTDKYPNVEYFFNELNHFESREDMIPFVDPYYLQMFFPKRTKTSAPACTDPPRIKIRESTLSIYVDTYAHGFRAQGFIIGFGRAK